MRRFALASSAALVLIAQGCTLQIPSNLLNTLKPGASPGASPVVDTREKPPLPPDPKATPEIGKLDPTCTPDAQEAMKRFDADADGRWSYDEFLTFYATTLAAAQGCAPPVDQPPVGLYRIKQVATATFAANGNLIASNDAGVFISSNADVLVPGQDMITPGPSAGANCYADPKSAFGRMDRDHDGFISMAELCSTTFVAVPTPIATTPPTPPVYTDCDGSFKQADRDGDGLINMDEYLAAKGQLYTNQDPQVNQPMIAAAGGGNGLIAEHGPVDDQLPLWLNNKQAFLQQDQDGDGFLSPDEWCGRTVSRPSPTSWPEPTPAPCGLDADTDNDGRVSWEEFYMRQQRMMATADMANAPTKDMLYLNFQKQDRNNDGFLDKNELCAPPPPVTTQPSPTPPVSPPIATFPGTCAKLFAAYDTNQDGFVDISEYAQGRWSELRFIKAPTPDEEKRQRATFEAQAKLYDANGDGKLNLLEFLVICPANGVDAPVTNSSRGG